MISSQLTPALPQSPSSPPFSLFQIPQIQHNLFTRYSSSQHYFYSNKIAEIIKQKCVPNNIVFEDIECLLDQQQYLKRQYQAEQFTKKLSTFKEYYYYHQDCPRIYGNRGIADAYQKWHERKRDYVYKKLKFMYNETYSSMDSSERTVQQQGNNVENVTHFLMDISEYNPYSKKYYLRVQARQQKQRQRQKQKQKQKNKVNDSAQIYKNLNMDLSRMLGKIINDVSTLTIADTHDNKYDSTHIHSHTLSDRKLLNSNQFQIGQAYKNLNRNPNINIKLNFYKKQPLQQLVQTASKIINNNNNETDKKQHKIINNNSQHHNIQPTDYVYIETQSSQNKKSNTGTNNNNNNNKHKKQISQSSNPNTNEFLSTHLLSNPILQLNKQKTRSILLMSTLGTTAANANANPNTMKNPLTKNKIQINFVGNKYDKQDTIGINNNNNGNIIGRKQQHNINIMDRVDSYNILKSYKSLQKYDQHKQHISIDKITKTKQHNKNPSTSSSTKQKQKQKNTKNKQLPPSTSSTKSAKNLLSTQINNKLSLRQNSLNKLGHPFHQNNHLKEYQNVQQFNDHNLVSQITAGVAGTSNIINYNYRSQQIQHGISDNQPNASMKLIKLIGNSTNANNTNASNNKINQNSASPKKNIRITIKNSSSTQKLSSNNANTNTNVNVNVNTNLNSFNIINNNK